MTIVHFLITSIITLPIAYFTHWMGHNMVGFVRYFLIFIGSFAVALAGGFDLQTALTRASAAGALAVTKAGAQSSLPTKEELDIFLKKHIKN